MKARGIFPLLGLAVIATAAPCHSADSTRAEPSGKYYHPWTDQELKVVNDLIGKNVTGGWSTSNGMHLPGEDTNAALKGLHKVQLSIAGINSGLEANGLHLGQIRTAVRKQLIDAGIEVVPFRTPVRGGSLAVGDRYTPMLCVDVPVFRHPDLHLCAYTCRVSLVEQASLARDPNTAVFAHSWWSGSFARLANTDGLGPLVQGSIQAYVRHFLDCHRQANQGTPPAPTSAEDTHDARTILRDVVGDQPSRLAFVASKSSQVFHKSPCRAAKRISPANLMRYNDRDEAVADGKRPCKICKP